MLAGHAALLERLREAAEAVWPLTHHPFADSRRTAASAEEEAAIREALHQAAFAAGGLHDQGVALAASAGVRAPAVASAIVELAQTLSAAAMLVREADVDWNPAQWRTDAPLLEGLHEGLRQRELLRQSSGVDPQPAWKLVLLQARRHFQRPQPGLLRGLSGEQRQIQKQLAQFFPGTERAGAEEMARRVELALAQLEVQERSEAAAQSATGSIGRLWLGSETDWQHLSGIVASMVAAVRAIDQGLLTPARPEAGPDLPMQVAAVLDSYERLDQAIELVEAALVVGQEGEFAERWRLLSLPKQKLWLQQRADALERLPGMIAFNTVAAECGEAGLGPLVDHLREGLVRPAELADALGQSYRHALMRHVLSSRGGLAAISTTQLNEAWTQFCDLTGQRGPARGLQIRRRAWEDLPEWNSAVSRSWPSLAAESESAFWSAAGPYLLRIAPILLCEPSQVHRVLAGVRQVDLLLILHPGPVPAWVLAPALLRARQVAVVSELQRHGVSDLLEGVGPVEEFRESSGAVAALRPFDLRLAAALRQRGYPVVERPVAELPLLVQDPVRTGTPLLGLISDQIAASRDGGLLATLDLPVTRLWSVAWYLNPEGELERLLEAIAERRRQAREPGSPAEHIPPYRCCRPKLRVAGQSLSRLSTPELVDAIAAIVAAESPVHMAEVARRVADAASLARLGARSLTSLETALLTAARDGRVIRRGNFLFEPGVQVNGGILLVPPIAPRERRGLTEAQRRVEMVAPEELDAAYRLLRHSRPASPAEDIWTDVVAELGLVGTVRRGAPAPESVRQELISLDAALIPSSAVAADAPVSPAPVSAAPVSPA
jgi:hypothetical protein